MNTIKLIATDIDDTLLDSRKRISARAKAAVREADRRGIRFCLASGRAPQAMGFLMEELGVNMALGCYSGALTFLDGQKVGSHALPFDHFRAILHLLEGFSCSTFIYGTNDWYSQTADQWYWKECKIVHYDGIVIDFNTLLKEHETAGIPLYKLVIMQEDPNILQQIEDALRGLGLGLMIFKSSPFFIEVNPMNIDKGTTINDVASHWDIDIADTLAIGNYYNDIGMLKAAGTSIAMANSPQAVKSCASRTSIQDMDHEGFALEMERILD